MSTTRVLLHTYGIEYTFAPLAVYVAAPEQRVQAQAFQAAAEWPLLPRLKVRWSWADLRRVWEAEERASKAEARRAAAKRRGIVVVVAGAPLTEPIRPRFADGTDPVLLAWRHRVLERALAAEPIRVEYGPDEATGIGYRVRLIGAWTGRVRLDLQPERERAMTCTTLAQAREAAEAVSLRLRRAGRRPPAGCPGQATVVMEAEAEAG